MAFTGVATILKVSDNKFRITGLSLAAAATGTISLSGGLGEVKLTAPGWDRYETSGVHGGQVELDSSIKVLVIPAVADPTTSEPITVVKTGDGPTDFLATLQNNDAAASGALEIYVEFH